MTKVLGIVGPTAVGKTSLSIQLAQRFNGEIISGDSMQVYRNLDIGTAKITPDEMAGIKHHLINIKTVAEQYTVANFVTDATELIQSIHARGKLPIIVGGTGFYLQALLNNLSLGGDVNSNGEVRKHFHQVAEQIGKDAMWSRLNQIDPQAAVQIPVNNLRRVIRALEVFEVTGHRFSEQSPASEPQYDALLIGLNTDRQLLYQRINQRVDLMKRNGLLVEAQWLFNQGGNELPAGKGIGYRELYPYFLGQTSLTEATAAIKQDSRHYAKRQLTWFRNKMDVRWFDVIQQPTQAQLVEKTIDKWLNR